MKNVEIVGVMVYLMNQMSPMKNLNIRNDHEYLELI